MINKILIVMLISLMICSLVSADVIIDMVDESSGVVFDKPLDLNLRDATVNISINEYGKGRLTATFEIMSKEEEEINARLYLKAKGKSCYGECSDVNITRDTTKIKMYYKPDEEFKKINPYTLNKNIPLIENEDGFLFYIIDDEALVIETEEGKFAGTTEFNLVPEEILVVEIEQQITLPFKYYLDSLSAFSKADHEKITINGNNLNVQFNDKYPVKKVSNNKWIWEYNNMNTRDQNLKDILVISTENLPEPKKSFFQKIVNWFKKLFS